MALEKGYQELLSWYHSLNPLRVDLIGDFAGKELFAIHGDALLLHCISEAKVDYQTGFQLLHAIHAVETFLARLQQRGCSFHILWFDEHEQLCVPTNSSKTTANCYRLTRAVLIKHLQHGLLSETAFQFHNADAGEFQQYLAANALRFFLCLDGFAFDARLTPLAAQHLAFVHQIASTGYNVVLINDFEFKSSKASTNLSTCYAFAFVLPPFPGTKKISIPAPTPDDPATVIVQLAELELNASITDKSWSPWEEGAPLSPKDTVSLASLCSVLLSDPGSAMQKIAVAYILHLSYMRRCSLASRPCAAVSLSDEEESAFQQFLFMFAEACLHFVQDLRPQEDWDLFDLLDGRILRALFKNLGNVTLSPPAPNEAMAFCGRIQEVTKVDISGFLPQAHSNGPPRHLSQNEAKGGITSSHLGSILPFQHHVLDSYLASINVTASDSTEPTTVSKIFQELSHWHNAKAPVDPKYVPPPPGLYASRRAQMLMADTIAYSASLTNASGKIINPETIVTLPTTTLAPAKAEKKKLPPPAMGSTKSARPDERSKNKKAPKKSGKETAREEAEKVRQEKLDTKSKTVMAAWDENCRELQAEENLIHRLTKSIKYLNGLSIDGSKFIGAEVLLYICDVLILMILNGRSRGDTSQEMALFAKIYSMVGESSKLTQSSASLSRLEKFSAMLKIPCSVVASQHHLLEGRKLPFKSAMAVAKVKLELPTNPVEFQLQHCGPFLERSFDAAPDSRVPNFDPDAWQRRVLDAIDAEKSLFVVAPTSAGKTFISFYAMKKVLQSSDDGIIVYVAPTKALVNQIAAEIQARFSKSYRHDGRSVWAIHTRDYRINNPKGCQVLVTVPHILQIMLLAPSNAENTNSWSRRVQRIIFDEVHCIGQAEDGVVWEQLLLLAPCPIIALSATVGNPVDFQQWLESSERIKGIELEMIVHPSRYSDLRKFQYVAPKDASAFRGLRPQQSVPTPGLDEAQNATSRFAFIHPIASLTNRNRGVIDDVTLEPRDCLALWRCMSKHQTTKYPLDAALDPKKVFSTLIRRSEVLDWGAALKKTLRKWMENVDSPFCAVRDALGLGARVAGAACNEHEHEDENEDDFEISFQVRPGNLHSAALPLLTDLHNSGALPAILFNYDRGDCEATLIELLDQLTDAEEAWKKSSRVWAKTLSEFAKWKRERAEAKSNKANEKKKVAKGRGQDGDDMSKADMVREAASVEYSKWSSFDPKAPLELFSFADKTKLQDSELKALTQTLRTTSTNPKIVAALGRGIAVHHAGMNRRYRQLVEMLFRKGFLRVVIATGTLALGLNMPCKTVVFFGDAVFLTALNYHQASGRAGRRGFDLLGNVVFVGMPTQRVLEIMSSRLPDLCGHFPFSTTLILRLLGLLHRTNDSEYAIRSMQAILSQSRLYLGGPSDQMAIQHHLRFSIEYLRRQQLLSKDGAALNFAGLIGHLYFTENAVFAFHSLLKEGYFHRMCDAIDRNPSAILLQLVLVLSHLFCRVPLREGRDPFANEDFKSPSVIILPRLPEEAQSILEGHNKETLEIFRLYVSTFVKQHLSQTPDVQLPFTGKKVQPQQTDDGSSMIEQLPPTKLRSPFAALSGFTDDFKSIQELCETVRSGVFLEESAVPYIRIYPTDTATPWNAYIYDFFKHGDLTALVRDNLIKRGDVWFHLKDFSLILATIVTSLQNFVSLSESTEEPGLMEEEHSRDEEEESSDQALPLRPASTEAPKQKAEDKPKAKKAAVLDSWEDDFDEGESEGGEKSDPSKATSCEEWGDDGNGSLLRVLKAFRMLQAEFDEKFRKVWA